ncbi:DNA repair protein RadC [Anaerosacchariphilus sp. NSJ-68]|uniref:DNA repair protein RadC n=2 Tax=Lachnospiraceae TaxID=186803 RepID=A0A923LDM9_9FIRM|nr:MULTISPECIES: DNA repair protein RadC [Lachnospiraceae]MBC5660215.1 DNA repair protein RadC [Anaerosacchariphilus hominis]MBC5699330.1 DNA repair protein RadC [Roseburia difficilis]
MSETTMKDLYEEGRPYEKCLAGGPEKLTDTELLAVMIRTGTYGESACRLAERILSLPGYEGLPGLRRIPLEKLRELRGVGKVKAVQLKCLGELAARMAKASAGERLCLDSPATIADYFMEELRHEEQEHLMALFLNTGNRVLAEKELFRGTVNAAPVSAREIFLEALKVHAVNLVLVHNHPSGDPTPSAEDIQMTRKIYRAGELLGIRLLDHVIIGDCCYTSLRERGILTERT